MRKKGPMVSVGSGAWFGRRTRETGSQKFPACRGWKSKRALSVSREWRRISRTVACPAANTSESGAARSFRSPALGERHSPADATFHVLEGSCRTLQMSHAHPKKGPRFERGIGPRKRTDGERWLWRLVGLIFSGK